jgi:phosphoglycerate dehydrogenase-like enzyme
MTIAVTSRSFSRHPLLRRELLDRHDDVRFNDAGSSLRGEELVAFLEGCEQAIVALEPIDDALLERLPALRVISKIGVGLDTVDVAAVESRGIRLAWSAGTNSRSVSELALALMISALRHLPQASNELRRGVWSQSKGSLLSGKTVGLVGYGHAGRDLASLLRPFDCRILAADVRPVDEPEVELVPLDELLAAADVVSLHVTLDESTRGLLDRQRLELMKPTAVLVNTARGGLVDEAAVAELLRDGRLGAAAFDVFALEPPGDSELLALPNFLGTPHIGGSTEEAILAMGRAAIDGLDA